MAIIGSIRKNGWILIVLMTLALAAFILMEIVQNADRNSAGDVNTMGTVNGEEIKRNDFDTYESLIYANAQTDPYQVRSQVWRYFVEKAVVEQTADQMGLNVGSEEISDLHFGNNISPIIAERFRGPDGQPNRATLSSIKAAIDGGQFTDPTNRAYWAVQEKEVAKQRLQEKINALVTKGVYTPKWQAEMTFREGNERLSFLYVRVPFESVSDTEVELTDADYKAFLADHPNQYDQEEETRLLKYVTFDVLPTAQDSAAAYNAIANLAEGFQAAKSDSTFVLANNGEIDPGFTPKAQLPASVADSMASLPLGTVIGPYQENGAWNLIKVLDRKSVPDSVRARHILIREATPANEARIDSLQALLESGRFSFDSLAMQNSADQMSAIKGGDLGYFPPGVMVPEFNEVCFYKGEQGKFYKVATQFGWHLIEITGKKFLSNDPAVKAAYISRRIEPSTQTQRVVKDKAIDLIETTSDLDEMIQKAAEMGLMVQSSPALKRNDYSLGALGSGAEAREVVRWAFDKKTGEGDISKEVFSFRDPNGGYFDSKYLVAGLSGIAPAGAASVASLKANPRTVIEVRNRKKAEVISKQLEGVNSLEEVASKYATGVDTSANSSFLQAYVQNGGLEPKVVGTAFGTPVGTVTGPIIGNSGVFFVMPSSEKNQVEIPADITMFRRQAQSTSLTTLRIGLMNSMKKSSDIDDMRSKFF